MTAHLEHFGYRVYPGRSPAVAVDHIAAVSVCAIGIALVWSIDILLLIGIDPDWQIDYLY